MTDLEIIRSLCSPTPAKALRQLYTYYPVIKRYILKNGGNAFDAEDIFQEALLALLERVQKAPFEATASLTTFLFSICKYKWKYELQRRNKSASLIIEPIEEQSIEELMILSQEEQEKNRLASKALETLGNRCWDVIKAFYYDGFSMKVIADKFGFTSEKIAKNQKYKCLEKARTELVQLKLSIR